MSTTAVSTDSTSRSHAGSPAGAARGLPRVLRGPRRAVFALLVGNGVAQAVAVVANGYAVAQVFTALSGPGGSAVYVALLAAGVAAASGLIAWLRSTEQTLAERVGQSYIHDVRMGMFDHLLTAPGARGSTGATSLRFTGDLTALRQWVSRGLARLAVAAPMLGGIIVFFAVLAPALALAGGAAILAGLGGLTLLGRRLRDSNRHARRIRSRLAADVTERISHLPVVIANGQQKRERDRVTRRSDQLRTAMLSRSQDVGRMRAATEATLGVTTAAIVAAAGVAAVPASQVAAAVTVLGFLAMPLRDLGRVGEYRAAALVSQERILALLARGPAAASARRNQPLPTGPGRLELSDVHLDGIAEGLNGIAEPGQVIAITGANGAGKSTLLRAIAGLAPPESGQVQLDGTDLATIRTRDLRRAVGIVAPDLPLLRGTVERNLRYRMPHATGDDITAVRRLTRLDEIIDQLPNQEKARLRETGIGLSTGQRSRLELARALLGTPRLLLLDEPDASLDQQTLRLLDDILADYPGTVLLVTHHAHRLAAADTIWHLRHGKLHTAASDQHPTADATQ